MCLTDKYRALTKHSMWLKHLSKNTSCCWASDIQTFLFCSTRQINGNLQYVFCRDWQEKKEFQSKLSSHLKYLHCKDTLREYEALVAADEREKQKQCLFKPAWSLLELPFLFHVLNKMRCCILNNVLLLIWTNWTFEEWEHLCVDTHCFY